jgi:hypothetical protein
LVIAYYQRISSSEHTDQCIEVGLVLIADVAAEPGSPFAVEHHQFREPGRFANSLSVTGNGLFGLSDRRILVPQHVWPEPAVQRFLVGPQNVLAQAEASVKKHLIIFVRGVKVLDQSQQAFPVETGELCLYGGPRGL